MMSRLLSVLGPGGRVREEGPPVGLPWCIRRRCEEPGKAFSRLQSMSWNPLKCSLRLMRILIFTAAGARACVRSFALDQWCMLGCMARRARIEAIVFPGRFARDFNSTSADIVGGGHVRFPCVSSAHVERQFNFPLEATTEKAPVLDRGRQPLLALPCW